MIHYLSQTDLRKFRSKTALVRVDLNIETDASLDSYRLEAVLPTIRLLLKNHIKVVILSHRGRPEVLNPKSEILNKFRISKFEKLSLKPFARVLFIELGRKVDFLAHFNFAEIKSRIEKSEPGSVFLLENLRFLPGEDRNDSGLAKQLALLGDFYVNDAFAVSHRKNASLVAITKYLPSYAGLLMEKEIRNLGGVFKDTTHPFVIVLGGAKMKDKILGLRTLIQKADYVLLGSDAFNESVPSSSKLTWPEDVKRHGRFTWDIGPFTIDYYSSVIGRARTIIWNGPPGFFEKKGFEKGTIGIWRAVLKNKKARTVIGGGETLASIGLLTTRYKLLADKNKNLFLSTGGGAMLECLSGKKLPGIEALK